MLSFSCLFINSSAGLAPQDNGVFLIARIPLCMSLFVSMHFFIIVLTVLTEDSASPLDRGYLGDDVMWWKSHSLAKFLNGLELNCDPLSETSSDGIPCLEKLSFNTAITCALPVFFSSYNSGYEE